MDAGSTFPIYTSSTESFSTAALFSASSIARAPNLGAGIADKDLYKNNVALWYNEGVSFYNEY